MSAHIGAGVPRELEAHRPYLGGRASAITMAAYQKSAFGSWLLSVLAIVAFCGVMYFVFFGLHGSLVNVLGAEKSKVIGQAIPIVFVGILIGGFFLYYRRSTRRDVRIALTGDGVTVNDRTYPFAGARLGNWGIAGGMSMGSVLHMQAGRRRFLIGGRDYRIPAGTPIEVPDVGTMAAKDVDAWLGPDDFLAVLAAAGPYGVPGVRMPVPGEAVRCLLFPNDFAEKIVKAQARFKEQQRIMKEANEPLLIVDLAPDAVRVHDAKRHTPVTSAAPGQVAAQPYTYEPSGGLLWASPQGWASDAIHTYVETATSMRVEIPGMRPFTLCTRDPWSGAFERRFTWPAGVPEGGDKPEFVVSGADFLTFAERFGLANQLQRKG